MYPYVILFIALNKKKKQNLLYTTLNKNENMLCSCFIFVHALRSDHIFQFSYSLLLSWN